MGNDEWEDGGLSGEEELRKWMQEPPSDDEKSAIYASLYEGTKGFSDNIIKVSHDACSLDGKIRDIFKNTEISQRIPEFKDLGGVLLDDVYRTFDGFPIERLVSPDAGYGFTFWDVDSKKSTKTATSKTGAGYWCKFEYQKMVSCVHSKTGNLSFRIPFIFFANLSAETRNGRRIYQLICRDFRWNTPIPLKSSLHPFI